ncbi:unnamed protein product [Nezara viridula]|uniref:Uncharacterized protein n=1 Tax=Nezara viridula TaxID=85310 RepID=A0A9P0HUX2_NEZVI|nr:unnamed protein product [Nezara viridula]
MYSNPKDGMCDTSCAQSHFCAVTRLENSEYRSCLEAAASALSSSAAPAVAMILLLIFSTAFYVAVT